MSFVLDRIGLSLGDDVVIDDVSLSLEDGSMTILLGPTLAGKCPKARPTFLSGAKAEVADGLAAVGDRRLARACGETKAEARQARRVQDAGPLVGRGAVSRRASFLANGFAASVRSSRVPCMTRLN